jgi:hypothetical protein
MLRDLLLSHRTHLLFADEEQALQPLQCLPIDQQWDQQLFEEPWMTSQSHIAMWYCDGTILIGAS